jgi:hypothetical protein
MPKKPTLRQLQAELGLSPDDMTRAKKEGINPYDRESMRRWKAGRQSYVRTNEPAVFVAESPRMTLDEIEDMASRQGLSKKETDVLKGQLEVMKAADALRLQRNKVLSRSSTEEAFTQISSALSAMISRAINEIPSQTEGLPKSQSAPKIKEIMRSLQAMLANSQSEFWNAHPEKE